MSSIKSVLIPYKASDINSYVLEISYNSIRFYTQHGIMLKDDEVYSIKSPYKYGELFDKNGIDQIKYTQNGDFLYLFHPNHKIKVVYRNSNNEWNIEDFEFKNGPWQSPNTTGAVLKVEEDDTGSYITSNVGVFERKYVGKLIRLTIVNTTVSSWVNDKQYYEGDYVLSDGKYYRCANAGVSGDIKPTHTIGLQSDGKIMWEYKHSGYGIAKVDEYVSDTRIKVTLQGEFPEELKVGTNDYTGTNYFEISVFGGECIYPMSGVFYRSRFAVLANINNIPTVYMSCSDDYDNFSDKDFGEVLDTNAITIPLYSNEYAIPNFLISGNVLFVGTSAGEFFVDSASSSSAMSPSNVLYKQFSQNGSLAIQPQKVGASVIYVSKQGVGLRNILYSLEKDGYDSLDISLFGKHLLYSGIKKIVYQELPNKVIWIVTQDGKLIGLTYMQEQKVLAYHRHDLGGDVVDVAIIPNPYNNYEDLWVEVKRGDDYCIEWMDIGFSLDEKEYFFVDSGLSLKREFETSFSETIKETSGALSNKEILVYQQGQFEDRLEPTGETVREIIVHGTKDNVTEDCGVAWSINESDKLTYNFELAENLIGYKIAINQFYTEDGVRKVKEILKGQYNSNLLNFEVEIIGENNSITITFNIDVKRDDINITGLDHLEGKEVKIMVNGAEFPNQIVVEGSVKIPYYATDIVVGLPIDSVFIPQTMYIQGNNGMGIGDVQRIDHITLMLHKSGGGKIGTDEESLQDIYFRSSFEKMGEETPLFSGNKTILVNSNTSFIEDKGAKIIVCNSSIYPMNILAISPKLSTSGNGL